MPVRAVVFDVDGTLVDHDRAQRTGLTSFLRDQGRPLTQDDWTRWRALEEHHFARYLAGELTFQGQRRERVRAFLGEPLDDDAADAWFEGYRAAFELGWTVYDDVLATLDLLSDRLLAAFSNVSGAYTRHKLTRVGLAERFAVVLGTDDVAAAKPAPAAFHAACRALGTRPGDTAHVGDRYALDASGACRAGLHGFWLDRPGADPLGRVPDGDLDDRVAVVRTLLDLPPRLR